MDLDKSEQTKNKTDFFIRAKKKYIIDIIVLNKFSVENNHRTLRKIVKINIKNTIVKMIKTKKKKTK